MWRSASRHHDYSIAYMAGWAGGDPGHEVRSDVTVFRSVRLRFDLHGVGDENAATLVEALKSRCPLHGTVAVAIPDVSVELESATAGAGARVPAVRSG